MELLYDTFDIPTRQEIFESQLYGKKKRNFSVAFKSGTQPEKYKLQKESAKKGRYFVEECANTD